MVHGKQGCDKIAQPHYFVNQQYTNFVIHVSYPKWYVHLCIADTQATADVQARARMQKSKTNFYH